MGRRSRRRTTTDRLDPPPVSTQTARVRVSDEMWRDFRRAIGDRPASQVLAGYVEAEVSAWLTDQLTDDRPMTRDEVAAAVRRLTEVERSARRLVDRLAWISAGPS